MAFEIRWIDSIADVDAASWNALFPCGYPFMQHGFHLALEQGRGVGAAKGWTPQYLLIETTDQGVATLIGAMSWYLKSHSYGEYLFDWAFAEAYERYGFSYYPKAICAAPFTPATGPRLGLLPPYSLAELLPIALDAAHQHFGQASCRQILYPTADYQPVANQQQWLSRYDVQFLWHNRDYQSFADFLAQLRASKRKSIRKERQRVAAAGIHFKTLSGSALNDDFWQTFSAFYQRTYLKRSGHLGYLTADTFSRWGQMLGDSIVVFAAYQAHELVAAALCFRDQNTLYGRYWGCAQEFELLHFEACYYQGIDYCIAQQLMYFDAGAQGEHKLQRGFEAVLRYGFYDFPEHPLLPAITDFCQREREAIVNYLPELQRASPYHREP